MIGLAQAFWALGVALGAPDGGRGLLTGGGQLQHRDKQAKNAWRSRPADRMHHKRGLEGAIWGPSNPKGRASNRIGRRQRGDPPPLAAGRVLGEPKLSTPSRRRPKARIARALQGRSPIMWRVRRERCGLAAVKSRHVAEISVPQIKNTTDHPIFQNPLNANPATAHFGLRRSMMVERGQQQQPAIAGRGETEGRGDRVRAWCCFGALLVGYAPRVWPALAEGVFGNPKLRGKTRPD